MNIEVIKSYIKQLAPYLEQFSEKNGLFMFRCPICGDSTSNKHKKRGYLYQKDNEYVFFCHNCGHTSKFEKFLRDVNSALFETFKTEKMKDFLNNNNSKNSLVRKKEIVHKPWILETKENLTTLNLLNSNHVSINYLLSRKIDKNKLQYIKWTENFKEIALEINQERYKDIAEVSGIVFELYDKNKTLVGYQLRNLGNNKNNRFMNLSIPNTDKGYFNINNVDFSKKLYVVEGCIDSLMLDNAIAVINSTLSIYNDKNAVYFSDQEPRNKEISKEVKRCIDKGFNVVLLPRQYRNMDLNDIVIKYNLNSKQLDELLTKYTYKGLIAKTKFLEWIK